MPSRAYNWKETTHSRRWCNIQSGLPESAHGSPKLVKHALLVKVDGMSRNTPPGVLVYVILRLNWTLFLWVVWVIKKWKLLLPILEPHLTKSTIFVEPFCGSSIVSCNIFKINKNIEFHINDLDPLRIIFYQDMTIEKERDKI